MAEQTKAELWRDIQANEPALAELLTALREQFGPLTLYEDYERKDDGDKTIEKAGEV